MRLVNDASQCAGARHAGPVDSVFQYSRAYPVLDGSEVHHYGEPRGVGRRRDGRKKRAPRRSLVDVTYTSEPGALRFCGAARRGIRRRRQVECGARHRQRDRRFRYRIQERHRQGRRNLHHALSSSRQPMEPHVCLAVPRGDDLFFYVSAQMLAEARRAIASSLRMDPQRVHLVTPYVGGGFGSKLGIHNETILAGFAARASEPARQDRDHAAAGVSSRQPAAHDQPARATRRGPRRSPGRARPRRDDVRRVLDLGVRGAVRHVGARAVRRAPSAHASPPDGELDLPRGEDVRSPGEAPGLHAFESAMDELAYALGTDPIELRIRNEPATLSRGRHPLQRS